MVVRPWTRGDRRRRAPGASGGLDMNALADAGDRKLRPLDRGRSGRREGALLGVASPHRKKQTTAPPAMLRAIHDLLRAGTRAEIFRRLADIAVTEVGADAAVLVEVLPGGDGRILEARGEPSGLD